MMKVNGIKSAKINMPIDMIVVKNGSRSPRFGISKTGGRMFIKK